MEIQLNQIQNLIFSSLFSIRFLLSPFDTVANRRLYFNVTRRTLIHIQIIFFRAAAVVGIESEISSLLKCLIPAPSEQHNKYINEIKILYNRKLRRLSTSLSRWMCREFFFRDFYVVIWMLEMR